MEPKRRVIEGRESPLKVWTGKRLVPLGVQKIWPPITDAEFLFICKEIARRFGPNISPEQLLAMSAPEWGTGEDQYF